MAATDMQQARPQALAPVAIARNSKEDRAHQQYLSFLLGKEMFALGILSVREIIEYGFVTDVPMTPSFIRGVLNLRGAVVPVVDLAVRFGCPRQENTRRTCIVIVEIETPNRSREMGVVVDAVSEVLEIPAHDIEPPPGFDERIRRGFIKGMGKLNNRFVIILDPNRIFTEDEAAVIAKMGTDTLVPS